MQQNLNIQTNSQISLPTQQYPNRQFQILKRLGQGGEGIVYLAQPLNWGINQNQVALKIQTEMSERQLNFIDTLINYQNQESKLTIEQKSQIVRVFEITQYQQKYVLIMEIGEMDLYQFMKNSSGKMNILKRIQILKDIIQPIKFLHFNNIFHRDIKPENYLKIGEEFKLIDFGMIKKKIEGQKFQTQNVGSPLFQAPEMAQGSDSYSQEVDIWSLGITFYEILTNQEYKPNQQNFVFQTTPEIPLSQSLEQALKNLLSGMLQQQPQDRFNIIKVSQELISLENEIVKNQMQQNRQQLKDQDTTSKSPKQIFPSQNLPQGFPKNPAQNQFPSFPQNQVPGFPQNQIPGFPQNQVPGFPQNQVSGFPQNQVPGFPQNQVPELSMNQFSQSFGQNQINPQHNQLLKDIQNVISEVFSKELNKISSELKEQFQLNQQQNQQLQSEIFQKNQTELVELKNYFEMSFKNLEQSNLTQKTNWQDTKLQQQQLLEQHNKFIIELKQEMQKNNSVYLNECRNIKLENSNKEIQQINNCQEQLNQIMQQLNILNKYISENKQENNKKENQEIQFSQQQQDQIIQQLNKLAQETSLIKQLALNNKEIQQNQFQQQQLNEIIQQLNTLNQETSLIKQLGYNNKEIQQIINQHEQLDQKIQNLNREFNEKKQIDNDNIEISQLFKNQLQQFNQSIQQLNISNQEIISTKLLENKNEEICQIKILQEQLNQIIQQLNLKNKEKNENIYEQITKMLMDLKIELLQTIKKNENIIQSNQDQQFNLIQDNRGNSSQKSYYGMVQNNTIIEKLSQYEKVTGKSPNKSQLYQVNDKHKQQQVGHSRQTPQNNTQQRGNDSSFHIIQSSHIDKNKKSHK